MAEVVATVMWLLILKMKGGHKPRNAGSLEKWKGKSLQKENSFVDTMMVSPVRPIVNF